VASCAAFAPSRRIGRRAIAATIESHGTRFRVASHAPDDPASSPSATGAGRLACRQLHDRRRPRPRGQTDAAEAITRASLDLIRTSGFAEYYDPHTGEPLGGGRFTWTAAMVLEFLAMAD
jgi:hypothetical protein